MVRSFARNAKAKLAVALSGLDSNRSMSSMPNKLADLFSTSKGISRSPVSYCDKLTLLIPRNWDNSSWL